MNVANAQMFCEEVWVNGQVTFKFDCLGVFTRADISSTFNDLVNVSHLAQHNETVVIKQCCTVVQQYC